jgi:hypothetical protein
VVGMMRAGWFELCMDTVDGLDLTFLIGGVNRGRH